MIVIHWLTALLILEGWLTSTGGLHMAESPPLLHFSFGLAVLVLALSRLILRFAGGTPPMVVLPSPPGSATRCSICS